MTEKTETSPKPVKKLVLKSFNGVSWEATFTGKWTRRDMKKIDRVIRVEFSKKERRRSLLKIMGVKSESEFAEKVNASPNKEKVNDPSTTGTS